MPDPVAYAVLAVLAVVLVACLVGIDREQRRSLAAEREAEREGAGRGEG